MKARVKAVLIISSICLITGCSSSVLSDGQILSKANQYAMAQGLNLQNYEVSLAPATAGNGGEMSAGEPTHPNLSRSFENIDLADTRAVVFMPQKRRYGGICTFYINKNTGKLVMVTKQK